MNTTSPIETTPWTPSAGSVPPVLREDEERVNAFIAAHNLKDWVELAIQIARATFPRATKITLTMFGAPGEYGESLLVAVTTGVDGDETLRQRANYQKRWLPATPAWVSELMGLHTEAS